MKKKVYASSEERAADLLYERLGKMELIKDKDGKPKEYVKVYPTKAQLIAVCEKDGVDLPEKPKVKDILLEMARAGYPGIRSYPRASLSERIFDKEQEKLGFPVQDKEKSKPVDEQQAAINKKEAEDAKLEAKRARAEADQAIREAEHSKNKAEDAMIETEQYKIIVEQTKIEAKLVELQYELDELELDPEKNKAKIDKNQAEKCKLEEEVEKLISDFGSIEAASKKKRIPDNKEAEKAEK